MADALDVQLFYMAEAREGAEGDSGWHHALDGRVKTSGRHVYAGTLDFAPALPAPAPVLLPVFRLAGPATDFETRRLPLRGRTAAGPPVLADDRVEEHLDLAADGLPSGPGLFLLRVDGESMTGDGIGDGELVVVRPQDHHEPDAVLVCLNTDDDTVTIKARRPRRLGRADSALLEPRLRPHPHRRPGALPRARARPGRGARVGTGRALTGRGQDAIIPHRARPEAPMDPDLPPDLSQDPAVSGLIRRAALRAFLAGLAVAALLATAVALASVTLAHGFQQGAVWGFGIGLGVVLGGSLLNALVGLLDQAKTDVTGS